MNHLGHVKRDKVRLKLEHREFGRIEDFVAKLSISFYTKNLEVDITTCGESPRVPQTKYLSPPPPE